MAATRVKSQDIKDGEVLVGDIGAAAVTFVKLSLAANPGLEDGGASVIQVKVAAPITLGAAGVGVSDFTSGANNPGVRGTVPAPVLGDITKFLRGDGTWAAPTGGVTGPGSSTDHAVVRWNGAAGTTLQDSNLLVVDAGAIQRQAATGTAVGGDTRGTYAVDLQTYREVAAQVASGVNSFAGGRSNQVGGTDSFAYGNAHLIHASCSYGTCLGSSNTVAAAGASSLAAGTGNTCNTEASIALGKGAVTTHYAEFAYASSGGGGVYGFIISTLRGTTADATPTELSIDGFGVQYFTVAASYAYSCYVMVQARKTGGGGASMFRQLLIERNGTTTQLVGAVQTVGVDINPSGYAITLTADDTNDRLKVVVTGAGTDALKWVVTILATKLAYT